MRQAGFSLIEVLISLLLGATISVGAVSLIQTLSLAYAQATRESERSATLLRTHLHLADTVSSLDSSPFPVGIRIHKRAQIKSVDGEANAVLRGDSLHRPLAGSDAVTSAVLVPSQAVSARGASLQGNSLRVTICPRWLALHSEKGYRGFLALTSTGHFEVVPNKPVKSLTQCSEARFSSTASLITHTARAPDLGEVRTLVPIQSIQTLYLDRGFNLRLLSHVGNRNIENQPIATGLKRFGLENWKVVEHALTGLQAELGTNRREQRSSAYPTQLARVQNLNFILNRP